MKFIDIVFALLAINLTCTFFLSTGIMESEQEYSLNTDTTVSETGKMTNNESLAYKISELGKQGDQPLTYFSSAATDTSSAYLQSGGDFIKALTMLLAIFTAVTTLAPTLAMFHVPIALIWFFNIPFYFLYALAVYEALSGRSLGGST